jgi:replication factor C subunit 1
MDEVDGMSSGDRGGVGALNALIKKSKVGSLLSDRTALSLLPMTRFQLYVLLMTVEHKS